jgi:hypothetical protein
LLLEPGQRLRVAGHGQSELAAARQDGRQQPVQAVGRQQEHRARRRLFQRLQQRVRGRQIQRLGRIQHHHAQALAVGGNIHEIGQIADLLDLDFLEGVLLDLAVFLASPSFFALGGHSSSSASGRTRR